MVPLFRPAALIVALSGLSLLAACSPPQGAAEVSQVLAGAGDPAADFAVVSVSKATLPMIATWPRQASSTRTAGWLPRGGGVRKDIIAPGDKFDLAMYSNEDNGLLTMPGQKFTPLQGLKVAEDGTLFLPYAGAVPVVGLSEDQARLAIQDKLATIMPSAQVTLNYTPGRDNSVQVVTGLPVAGVVSLPDHDFTVLDLIAASGGVPATLINPQIQVARGGKLYGTGFDNLVQNPSLDAVLRPGDRIYVQPEDRYFMSLGAATKEAQIPFPRAEVSALDAVTLIGGLNDKTADPKGVLVLRNYPASAVRTDDRGPSRDRMIFVFDLMSADGLFSAGKFQIQDQDLVMIAQAPLVNQAIIVTYLSTLLEVPTRAVAVALSAQKF